MIPRAFDEITKADVEALIESQVSESKTIEYKQYLNIDKDREKRDLLEGISAFANSQGGDLVFGVSEKDGIPKEVTGLECNADETIRALEDIIRNGIEPLIHGINIKPIEGFSRGPVILIRIPSSWISPHLVTFKKQPQFYIRTSAGKQPMDVTEIRSAFLLSEALPEKMKRFRDERLGKIMSDDIHVSLIEGAKLVIHFIPAVSFSTVYEIDLKDLPNTLATFRPVNAGGWDDRYNAEGFVTFSSVRDRMQVRAYNQVFRTGQIEVVASDIAYVENGLRFLASSELEKNIITASSSALRVQKKIGLNCPILLLVSILGIKDTNLAARGWRDFDEPTRYRRENLILPDLLIEEWSAVATEQDVSKFLRPAFDVLWNAFGYVGSENFDTDGNWKPRR